MKVYFVNILFLVTILELIASQTAAAKAPDPDDLAKAAFNCEFDDVKKLLEQGADPNQGEYAGDPPLHAAARCSPEMVQVLIGKGAKVEKSDDYGNTALFQAVRSGNLEIIRLLIRNGANANKKNKHGDTPLIIVIKEYSSISNENLALEIIKILIEHGADVDAYNHNGETPLGLAQGEFFQDAISYLVLKGAKKYKKTLWTPLQVSIWPETQLFKSKYKVYGISLDLLIGITKNEVFGLSLGLFGSEQKTVYGIQFVPFGMADGDVRGLQIGLAPYGEIKGIQIGLINNSTVLKIPVSRDTYYISTRSMPDANGIQIAAFSNHAKNLNGIQLAVVWNNTKNVMKGVQAGSINTANVVHGIQAGIINVADEVHGIQIGILNYAKRLTGIQIGLANINRNGKLPFLPLLNIDF